MSNVHGSAGPEPGSAIPALLPRGAGHQFLVYGDSCSGVPGALHEAAVAAVNKIVQRLEPQPVKQTRTTAHALPGQPH